MRDLHTAALDMMIDVSNAKNEDDQTVRVLRQLKAFRAEVLEEAAVYCETHPYVEQGARPDAIRALKDAP